MARQRFSICKLPGCMTWSGPGWKSETGTPPRYPLWIQGSKQVSHFLMLPGHIYREHFLYVLTFTVSGILY